MKYIIRCTNCGREWDKDVRYNRCPNCGGLLEITYDYSSIDKEIFKIGTEIGISKYKGLLPMEREELLSMGEGNTPLIKSKRLAKEYDLRELYLKNETVNPTGSFVDRGVSILSPKIRKFGLKNIVAGFSPNFAISLSAYLARYDIKVNAILPRNVSIEKIYQLVAYGTEISFSDKPYQQENLENFFDQGNPYYSEGVKTIIFEIFQQKGGDLPDYIFVPTGTGSQLSMIWKGLKEMEKIGLVDTLETKLVAVQPETCSYIIDLMQYGEENGDFTEKAERGYFADLCTWSKDIAKRAVEAIKESKGFGIKVPNSLIYRETIKLARLEGIFPEPAGAASIAGIINALNEGLIDKTDKIIAIITGGGLKDASYVRSIIEGNKELKAKLHSVLRYKKSSLGRTKHIILEIINSNKSLNIYEIWKTLNEKYNINIRYPTVLQHMRELEELGLVVGKKIKEKRRRTIYSITEKGKKLLEAL